MSKNYERVGFLHIALFRNHFVYVGCFVHFPVSFNNNVIYLLQLLTMKFIFANSNICHMMLDSSCHLSFSCFFQNHFIRQNFPIFCFLMNCK